MAATDRCLENVDLFQFLLVSRYVARDVEPVKIARGCNLTFVSSRLVSFLSPAVYLPSSLSLFFLSRPHSHSNLFERIIHARVMLEMHSREEGSAAIHRVRHSLYFIFLLPSILFSRHYSTHCGCAYFFGREAVRCKSQLYSRYFGDRNWFSNFCTSTCSDALQTRKWSPCN